MTCFKKYGFPSDLHVRTGVTRLVLVLLTSTSISSFAVLPKNQVVATISVGSLPDSLVVSSGSNLVYVANEAYSISVIDATNNTVGSTIPVTGQPFFLALSSAGYLYCTEYYSSVDLQISLATQRVTNTYPTGNGPRVQAVSPDGTLVYVPNYLDGTVTVISNGVVQTPISVGGNPVFAIFRPEGDYAYVANQSRVSFYYYVSVINVATNSVVKILASAEVPYPFGGFAISPDGTKLYLTGIDSHGVAVVAVIDTSTNQVTNTIALRDAISDPGQPAITPNGNYLYVPISNEHHHAAPYNKVVMVNLATNALAGHIVVGTQPLAVAIAPDGRYAYVTNFLDGTVSVIDITPR